MCTLRQIKSVCAVRIYILEIMCGFSEMRGVGEIDLKSCIGRNYAI